MPPRPNLRWTEDLGVEAMRIPKHRLRRKTARFSGPAEAVLQQKSDWDPALIHPEVAQRPEELFDEQDPFGFAQLDSFL